MHKYSLEVVIYSPANLTPPIRVPLPDTTFIAVPAFQNVEFMKTKLLLGDPSNTEPPKPDPWTSRLNDTDSGSPLATDDGSGASEGFTEESSPDQTVSSQAIDC